MNIEEKIKSEIKTAMLAKDKDRLSPLRDIKSNAARSAIDVLHL